MFSTKVIEAVKSFRNEFADGLNQIAVACFLLEETMNCSLADVRLDVETAGGGAPSARICVRAITVPDEDESNSVLCRAELEWHTSGGHFVSLSVYESHVYIELGTEPSRALYPRIRQWAATQWPHVVVR